MGLLSSIASFFTGGSSGSNSSKSNNSQKTTTTKTTTTTTTTKKTTKNTNSGGTTKKTNNPSNSNPVSAFVNNVTNFASGAVETVTNFASDAVETVTTTLSDIGDSVNQAIKSTGTAGTATGDTTKETVSPRSNSEVNEKYQKTPASKENTVTEHSSSPTYVPPADTVPKTITQSGTARSNSEVNSKYEAPTAEEVKATISEPEKTPTTAEAEFYSNKVVDTGTKTPASTPQESDSISEIYDNTIIAWRDNQYDKAVDGIINEKPVEAIAAGVPAILADIAAPLDALGVTLKILDIVTGTNENAMAQTSDSELVAGGIDAAITALPVVGPILKTTADILGIGTKVTTETAETTAKTTLKGVTQDAGTTFTKTADETPATIKGVTQDVGTVFTKTADETPATIKGVTQDVGTVFTKTADETPVSVPKKTTNTAPIVKPADDIAESIAKRDAKIDTGVSVISPIAAVLGTAATLALEDGESEPQPEQNPETPVTLALTRTLPTTTVKKEQGMWGIGDVVGGNGVGHDSQSEFLVAESAPIDGEVDRIIANYAIPAAIAGCIVTALAVAYITLEKGGKTHG